MTSNGVPISHLGDPPTAGHHQCHGLYLGRDSWWILEGKEMKGVLRRMSNNAALSACGQGQVDLST